MCIRYSAARILSMRICTKTNYARSSKTFSPLLFARHIRELLFIFMTVPVGSPSRGGNVTVYIYDINQLSLLTPFYSVLVSISVYGPFNCISFHKFSRQHSAFSLFSPGLISAILVLSTIYLFIKVSFSLRIIL